MSAPGTATVTVSGQRFRRCYRCREWKPLPDFHRDRSDGEGRTRICAVCNRAKRRAYRAENVEQVRRRDRDRKRARRARDIERLLAAISAPTIPGESR